MPNIPAPDNDLLLQCIHCGMCLPTCPTYALTQRERSSPRGRIRLIKAVAEGQLPLTPDFQQEMYFCLDCRACETACPAGVQYGPLVEAARAEIQNYKRQNGRISPTQELILRKIYPVPSRFRRLAKFLRLYQVSGLEKLVQALHLPALFSKKFATLSRMAPRIEAKFSDQLLPEVIPARGEIRYRVALLTGCVQDVAFATVNRDTAHVLAYDGCEVWIPRPQVCCGSLHGHIGDQETAARLAQQTLDIFSQRPVDAIIVNAAGCGSFMKHYARLFENAGLSQARRQQFLDFSARVKDIHEFLLEIGFRKPEHAVHATVTYHDACHLAHGQKITRAPREILQSIPGLQLVPLAESDWCCGSAGIYNITHTDTSLELLDRKMGHIRATGAQIVASANPGCNIQLAFGVKRHRLNFEVVHPVSLLSRAYGNL